MDDKNLHAWKPFRVGRITKDLRFEVVFEAKTWIAPEPDPRPAQAATRLRRRAMDSEVPASGIRLG